MCHSDVPDTRSPTVGELAVFTAGDPAKTDEAAHIKGWGFRCA